MTIQNSAAASTAQGSASQVLLQVSDLVTTIRGHRGSVTAVDHASLTLRQGEILGLVGESGSGKSLLLLSILGLVAPPVEIRSGSVRLNGRDLTQLDEKALRNVRGTDISMIFQEPLTSLDPAFTIGRQLVETVRAHRDSSRREAADLAVRMLERVGIGSPASRMKAYPHELSGGMRQRAMIGMALLLQPSVVLADEPVTALDVTTQAQILELIVELQRQMGMGVVLVSHDLGVLLDVADRVAVMYAGQIVEVADALDVATSPMHPYTRGLLVSKLSLIEKTSKVDVMPGHVPSLSDLPRGCRFANRCPRALPRCGEEEPDLEDAGAGRTVRCFNPLRGDPQ